MGRLFQGLFEGDGYRVSIAGRRTELTYEQLATEADVVIVTVPIERTAEIVARIAPVLRPEQLLSDFTSIKAEPVRAMLATPACVIGCHPVFGPVPDVAGQNVVLCPARPGPYLEWYRDWFRSHLMHVEIMDPDSHDASIFFFLFLSPFFIISFSHTLFSFFFSFFLILVTFLAFFFVKPFVFFLITFSFFAAAFLAFSDVPTTVSAFLASAFLTSAFLTSAFLTSAFLTSVSMRPNNSINNIFILRSSYQNKEVLLQQLDHCLL